MKSTGNLLNKINLHDFALQIKRWGLELGFQQVGITDTDLTSAKKDLLEWLAKNYQGDMQYMSENIDKRTQPEQLVPGTLTIISVRLNYLPPNTQMAETLNHPTVAYISRYALGRDYHKLMRKRLQQLAKKINTVVGEFGYRAFSDSAPVMEKPLAAKAGLGWIGKNTLLLNREAGSWFFLGELFTDLPLPVDSATTNHCGSCTACLTICPTQAFVAPYQLDARRCISYLTIENKGAIPEELREPMGNRIFGCDDCQLICPWNKFAKITDESDFHPRHGLATAEMIDLFAWTEAEFLTKTEGSAIRRAGYQGWLRNLAVALGNAPTSSEIIQALQARLTDSSTSNLVKDHIIWALKKHQT